MTNLDTYNRVRSLERKRLFTLVNLCYTSLLLCVAGSVASIAVVNSWYVPAASLASVSILAFTSFYFWDRHRVKHCQFCHTALSTINRPIHLDRQYLSMQGLKEGDYFYTKCRWGANRFVKRWTKISNRYNACHRCRLTEETAYKYYESITLQEQQRLESAIYK